MWFLVYNYEYRRQREKLFRSKSINCFLPVGSLQVGKYLQISQLFCDVSVVEKLYVQKEEVTVEGRIMMGWMSSIISLTKTAR